MYEVLLERSVIRELRKLQHTTRDRVLQCIRALAEDPRPSGCRKIAGSRSDFRVRVGSHRVIYEIDEDTRKIRIMRVRHRRDVYR